MKERKNLFDMINEICDENDSLHKENKWLKEEIGKTENARIVCDAKVTTLLKERNELREKIDDKDEIIQSLYDEIEAKCEFTKKVIKERDDFCNEMKLMVKDHEEECEVYETTLKSKVDLDDIHIILADYISHECVPEFCVYILFKIMDKIKEYIDKK